MRNIFIINPASGGGAHVEKLVAKINKIKEDKNINAEYYITESVSDAEHYAKQVCIFNETKEELRFFVCGGDGTLNEVLNGVVNCEEASVGVIPVGTGNDFIRNFGDAELFLDLEKQLNGEVVTTDVIKYTYEHSDKMITKYGANMFNIGFDCNVVVVTQTVKRLPFISGHLAYLLSLVLVLIKKMGAELNIDWETSKGEKGHFDGKVLLTAIANGCYCGGGVKGIPLALVNDGEMDLSIIKNMSRTRLVTLYGKYAKGTHLGVKSAQPFITYEKCRKISITPKGDFMRLCVDGEVMITNKVDFEIVPSTMKFIVPR